MIKSYTIITADDAYVRLSETEDRQTIELSIEFGAKLVAYLTREQCDQLAQILPGYHDYSAHENRLRCDHGSERPAKEK